MTSGAPRGLERLRDAYAEFRADGGDVLSAALAYHVLFALAPGLVLFAVVAAGLLGAASPESEVFDGFRELIGPELTEAFALVVGTAARARAGLTAGIVGTLVLVWAVGLLFVRWQESLNRMWCVTVRRGAPPGPVTAARVKQFTVMLLPLAILMVQAAAAAVARALGTRPLFGWIGDLARWLGSPPAVVAGALLAFFMVYTLLPDVRVPAAPALAAAVLSAAGWTLGTWLFGQYLAWSGLLSGYGAAGSAFVLLIWLNYSARLVLVSCKATKLWVEQHGGIEPAPYAAVVVTTVGGE